MTQKKMNGAESLVHTLIGHGLKVCFANPGTSEMHFVAALDRIPGLRCIPGLQENVVTGMADGYARVLREPAITLLHCGPGLANGLANIHNAKKARVPMLNIVGDQATHHAKFDPPLATDTVSLAKSSSHWVKRVRKSADVGKAAAEAIRAARTTPGQIATLVLPSDASWNEGGKVAAPLKSNPVAKFDMRNVRKAARILREKRNVLLLLGGSALMAKPQAFAASIQAKSGCRIMAESFNGFQQRGRSRLPIERVPYAAPVAIDVLKNVEHIITVCARAPLGFFAYPGLPSHHYPAKATVTALASAEHDAAEALAALADELSATLTDVPLEQRAVIPKGRPSSAGLGVMLGAVIPENAIIADEAVSLAAELFTGSHGAAPHDWMMVTGGAIGYGMPCATGAAVAGAGRRVINMQADGSAMYTVQALWTQARERLPVTTVILSNRKYQILIGEYGNVGANAGPTAMNMLDLGNPDMDWVKIANGMGVEAAKTDTLEGCAELMLQSYKSPHPFLIELEIETPHATVIGAGIVGISTAAFLQREGFTVTVVDRVPPGEGCSFGNAGGLAFAEILPTIHPGIYKKLPGWLLDPLGPLTIRWSYLPKALPWFMAAARNTLPARFKDITKHRAFLGMRVVSDFEDLLKAAGRHDLMVYRETLRVFDSQAQFDGEANERAIKKEHGFPVESFSGDEAREMEPDLSPAITHASTHGGWYFVRDPEGVVKAIAEKVARDGSIFLQDEVKEIKVEDGKATFITLTSRKSLPIDRLVICTGAYSHLLARQLGDNVLLEAERGYHIMLPDPGVKLSRSITYARTPGAATPMAMGLRLAGTDEFAGLDAAPNYKRADALWHVFKRALPGLRAPDEKATRWMGRRPGTPDSLPAIGPSKHVQNVFYGFGHGHMGLTWGPSTGRMLAELMSGKPVNADVTPFRVDRF